MQLEKSRWINAITELITPSAMPPSSALPSINEQHVAMPVRFQDLHALLKQPAVNLKLHRLRSPESPVVATPTPATVALEESDSDDDDEDNSDTINTSANATANSHDEEDDDEDPDKEAAWRSTFAEHDKLGSFLEHLQPEYTRNARLSSVRPYVQREVEAAAAAAAAQCSNTN